MGGSSRRSRTNLASNPRQLALLAGFAAAFLTLASLRLRHALA